MSLNEFRFILFFLGIFIILVLLEFVGRKYCKYLKVIKRVQIVCLLCFSWMFIALFDWRFLLCVFLITGLTYCIGIKIEQGICGKVKPKVWLAAGIVVDLLILGYFKYCNFFLNIVVSLLGLDNAVANLLLPVGISFYIFSSISYMIDIYREKYCAEHSWLHMALYIAFFPKFIAGPIIRGAEFLPQVQKYKGITLQNAQQGIQIFVFGLFKKMVLADHLGVFVDDVFYAPMAYHSATVLWAVLSYSLQIYFDFSGYSDMAIGISKIVGFDFSENFNLPYIAKNIPEFWKRWHISLSSWFQEYCYYSLGGNRRGNVRTCLNLLIVMFLSGLWHGTGMTFIIWGLLYGIASCVHRIWKQHIHFDFHNNMIRKIMDFFNISVTFIIVSMLWVIFRADDMQNAMNVLKGVFIFQDGIIQPYTWTFFAGGCLVIATIAAFFKSRKNQFESIKGFYPIMDLSKFWSLVCFFTFIGVTVIMGYYGNTAFIYGEF